MKADDLVLAANNDRQAYNSIVLAVSVLRRAIDRVAENAAKSNAEWHDDPEAEDYKAFHAPANVQFSRQSRDKAIIELVRYYLRETTLQECQFRH